MFLEATKTHYKRITPLKNCIIKLFLFLFTMILEVTWEFGKMWDLIVKKLGTKKPRNQRAKIIRDERAK